MNTAYIIDAVRTPVGKKKGSLAGVHPADLGAHVHQGADRADAASIPGAIDDVVFGAVDTIGPLAGRHRAHVLARRGPARPRARHDGRPAVRIVAAGACISPRRA